MSAKKQGTLDAFWKTPARTPNNQKGRILTPAEKEMIRRKKEEALARRRAHQQRQQQQQTPARNGAPQTMLTPSINRMSINHNQSNNGNSYNVPNTNHNHNRSPLHTTTNTVLNGNGSNHNQQTLTSQRSLRKRTRQQYNQDNSDSSPVQPRKKARRGNHSRKIIDDSEDEYNPDNDLNHQTESDYTSPSSSPIRKKRTQRRLQNDEMDEDEDIDITINDRNDFQLSPSSNNHNRNNHNNNNNGSKKRYSYKFNAKEDDPKGLQTFDRIAQFGCIDNDDDNDDDRKENPKFERDPQYIHSSYSDFKEYQQGIIAKAQKELAKESEAAGAAHRDISNQDWYKNPRDHKGNKPGDKDYNPSQLRIPKSILNAKKCTIMTPGQQQYWKIKQNCFDGILFFKVGKFYELYCQDADIGHQLCGLEYMAGGSSHVGFPEKSFTKYAEIFVSYGYKVYRAEQMTRAKGNELVKREVCEVITNGTITREQFLDERANYILSIAEAEYNQNVAQIDVGICYMDLSTGQCHLGRFTDDRNRSRLRTLICQINPNEVIFKKSLGAATKSMLRLETIHCHLTPLAEDEFFSSDIAKDMLKQNKYWGNGKFSEYPKAIQKAWNHNLTMNAFGGMLFILQHTLKDQEVLPHSRWSFYDPSALKCNKYLTLDGSTLANLEILYNESGTRNGTLFEFVNHCSTKFGTRMLERWLRAPSNQIDVINERLDAVQYLIDDMYHWRDIIQIKEQFRALPDLERILQSLAILGTKGRKSDKAVMFEKCWDIAKVNKLLSALTGFEAVEQILIQIENHRNDIKSKYVDEITTIKDITKCTEFEEDDDEKENTRYIPEFGSLIKEFKESFDLELAEEEGIIRPTEGKNAKYDKVRRGIHSNDGTLEGILVAVQSKHRSQKIKWFHKKKSTKKDQKYNIEIPKTIHFVAPDDWHHRSETQNVVRYQTDEILRLLEEREKLLNEEEELLRDAARATFARFAENGGIWTRVVTNIGILDCLLSLAEVSEFHDGMTRPQFIKQKPNDPAFLEIRECRHPCIDETQLNAVNQQSSTQFIPNDTVLGCKENSANFVIVTGPNMGGKSTLLRQTCVAIILAHLGCFVPCKSMRLSPVDRIFTRVGANDRILAGQSTFMVELEETSNVLRHATKNSLVILDELGRGTSTFDGTAIAYAVAKQISEEIQCRCLFSTHYHGLCESFENNKKVAFYHMAYKETGKTITFLYKFIKGICDQSHGINCAKMAGLSQDIIDEAEIQRDSLHEQMHNDEDWKEPEDAQKLLGQFKKLMVGLMQDTILEDMQKSIGKNGNFSG